MAMIGFPTNIFPTSRTYRSGRLPETVFEARNGATTFVQYGRQFVNAELDLEFANINDHEVIDILQHYRSMTGDDFTYFDNQRGLQGMDLDLQEVIETGNDTLRWRYAGPPEVRSIYPAVSTVRIRFIGYLYGA